jgi:hypothetical protein
MVGSTYRIEKQTDSTYSVVVILPGAPLRGANGFATTRQAQEWIEADKRRPATDTKDANWHAVLHDEGMPAEINDPEHWRAKAAEAQRVAETLMVPEARKHLRAAAVSYERLAALLEEAPVSRKPPPDRTEGDSL